MYACTFTEGKACMGCKIKVLVWGIGLSFWSKIFGPRFWSEVFGPRFCSLVLTKERISWFALFPWFQRGKVPSCCLIHLRGSIAWSNQHQYGFHQVQMGRLLALWCMCCTWWKPTCRRETHLYMVTRWIYRRDIRCDRIHGSFVYWCDKMQGSSKESFQK